MRAPGSNPDRHLSPAGDGVPGRTNKPAVDAYRLKLAKSIGYGTSHPIRIRLARVVQSTTFIGQPSGPELRSTIAVIRSQLRRAALTAALLVITATSTAQGLTDLIEKIPLPDSLGKSSGDMVTGALSNDEVIGGLKQALAKGTRKAIKQLGSVDGFLGNPEVKIPLPENLQLAEKTLRALGQDRYADDFVKTMNRAAENAVPAGAKVFGNAIRKMTLKDARSILDGPDDAATQYFRRVGEKPLHARFLPIVKEATAANGVTAAYKEITDKASLVTSALGQDSLDVDEYVTGKALDGLFKMIAAEEARIRTNPAARTTELLKKVFQ
jgi:hypothetical protein